MKSLRRIVISLSIAFFAVCCGAVLLTNWQITGWKALSVPTGSMRPTIAPGSVVLMHSVPVSSVKVGDVITYTNPENQRTTITHRVIKTYKLNGVVPAFITKGDANPSPDRPVVGGQVQGVAVWHASHVGQWLGWGKTWIGISVLVYLPAVLLMIGEAQRLGDYYRRSRPYKLVKGYIQTKTGPKRRLVQATTVSLALVAGSAFVAFPAQALMRSNTVTLGPNNLSIAAVTPPPPQCTGNSNNTTVTVNGTSSTNHNNVVVNNNSSQSSSTGNASSSGNTNGGSATSGNASNSNCTNTTVTITNH